MIAMSNLGLEQENDGAVDVYLRSLDILRDKTLRLLTQYKTLIDDKIKFDRGNVQFEPFETCFKETMAQCDYLEAQLQNMESWLTLPASRTADLDLDSVTYEAHNLCKITESVRNSLQLLITSTQTDCNTT